MHKNYHSECNFKYRYKVVKVLKSAIAWRLSGCCFTHTQFEFVSVFHLPIASLIHCRLVFDIHFRAEICDVLDYNKNPLFNFYFATCKRTKKEEWGKEIWAKCFVRVAILIQIYQSDRTKKKEEISPAPLNVYETFAQTSPRTNRQAICVGLSRYLFQM